MSVARWMGFGISALVHGSLLVLMPQLFAQQTVKPEPEVIPISLAMFEPPPEPVMAVTQALPETLIETVTLSEPVVDEKPAPKQPEPEPVVEKKLEPKPAKPAVKPQPDQQQVHAERQRREQQQAEQRAREQAQKLEQQRQADLVEAAEQARLEQQRKEQERVRLEQQRVEREQARLAAEQQRIAQEKQLTEQKRREWAAKQAAAEAQVRLERQKQQQLVEQKQHEWEVAQIKARQQQVREQAQARQAAEQRQREAKQKRAEVPKVLASGGDQGVPVLMKPSFRSKPRAPDYPERALQAGIEGTVVVRAQVSAQGQATTVQVHQSSGHTSLDVAAVNAVKGWEFLPAQRDGQNIASIVQVPVNFNLN